MIVKTVQFGVIELRGRRKHKWASRVVHTQMCGYLSTKYVCVNLLSTNIHTLIVVMWINELISSVAAIAKTSLVPRPRPAFRCLQYRKVWRAWYLFSREHDVIGKWQKFSEQTGCISSIVQPTTRSTLGVYDNRPPLARYVRYVTCYVGSFCCSGPSAPMQN